MESQRCERCGEINTRKRPITCNDCNGFFHLTCVGLTRHQADALTLWSCDGCQGLRNPTPVPENDNVSHENFSSYFCNLKQNNSVIVKIPKSALNHVAGALDTLLRNACQLPATGAWEKLICFPYWGLRQPDKSPQNRPDLTLTTKVKNQVDEYMACTGLPDFSPREPSQVRRQSTNQEDALRRRVNIKFMEGDIRGAVREVCSSNCVDMFSSVV